MGGRDTRKPEIQVTHTTKPSLINYHQPAYFQSLLSSFSASFAFPFTKSFYSAPIRCHPQQSCHNSRNSPMNMLFNALVDVFTKLCPVFFLLGRVRRVGFFNFGSGRVRVLEKIIGSGRVRVRVLVTYIESIGYYRVSKILIGYFPILSYLTLGVLG